MIFLWGLVGLVLLVLFVLMLRNMFFEALDRRAADEYLTALDEPTPKLNSINPDTWLSDGQFDDRQQRLLRRQGLMEASNNWGRRGTLYQSLAATASGPGPTHAAMLTEDGRALSPNYNYSSAITFAKTGEQPSSETFDPRQIEDAVERFNTIKDRL